MAVSGLSVMVEKCFQARFWNRKGFSFVAGERRSGPEVVPSGYVVEIYIYRDGTHAYRDSRRFYDGEEETFFRLATDFADRAYKKLVVM